MNVEEFKKVVYSAEGKPIEINYTNWQGKTEDRVISPQEILFMKTIWHPTEQWCVLAFCHHRQAERVFAVCDIHKAEVSNVP